MKDMNAPIELRWVVKAEGGTARRELQYRWLEMEGREGKYYSDWVGVKEVLGECEKRNTLTNNSDSGC
jgi:hypothetical protein